ncbi:MAG: winged helix-turn-helix domain-containing protein [Labilithrix sp.]
MRRDRPATAQGRVPVELRRSLRFELFYALASVFDRTARVHARWRGRVRPRLPRSFWREARVLGPARELWIALPAALTHETELADWESLSAALDGAEPHALASAMLKGLLHANHLVDEMLETRSVRAALRKAPRRELEWLRTLGLVPFRRRAPLAAALEAVVADPAAAIATMRRIVRQFWEHAFAATFLEAAGRYASAARGLDDYRRATSLEELFADSLLRVRLDGDSLAAIEGGYRVRLSEVERIVIHPSAFNERRYWSAVPGRRGTIVYLPWFMPSLDIEPATDGGPVLPALQALADDSRWRMVQELLRRPQTASELAASCRLGKATISHHVRVLADADLVTRAPRRATIVLSANPAAIGGLGERILVEARAADQSEQPGAPARSHPDFAAGR